MVRRQSDCRAGPADTGKQRIDCLGSAYWRLSRRAGRYHAVRPPVRRAGVVRRDLQKRGLQTTMHPGQWLQLEGHRMTVKTMRERKGRNVVTVHMNATLKEALSILAENDIGAMVITDEDGQIRGILSERDIVRLLAAQGAQALAFP